MMRLLFIALITVLLSGCGPQVEGEYTSSKTVLFSTVTFSLRVDGDVAELSFAQGKKKPKVEQFVALEKDGRLIVYQTDEKDKQLIFTILDEGKKLRYEPSSTLGLPEIWVKKEEI